MPSFEIVKKSPVDMDSFRVNSVIGSFDLQITDGINERFSGNIPIENSDWKIGVIFGASGTGKTTIAREIMGDDYFIAPEFVSRSVIDDMPKDKSVEQITRMFTGVGFGSVPSWLKSYSVLSNGEKMRVDIAYALLSDREAIVFDEFTSVVDRQVARIGSMCIQKNIRKSSKKFVAVSCHDDVIDWIEPDWVFDTDSMLFTTIKKKDQKSKLKYSRQTKAFGNCLAVITI